MKFLFALLVLCVITLQLSSAYKILFVLPMASRSHKNGLDPIAEELGLRGHEVTVMSSIRETTDTKGVKNVFLPLANEVFERFNINFFATSGASDTNFLKTMMNLMYETCNATYHEPEVMKLWNISSTPVEQQYHAMIIDAGFNDFVLPIAHLLGLPVILVSPAVIHSNFAYNLNIPHPVSYLPSFVFNMTAPLTFYERTINLVSHAIYTLIIVNYCIYSMFDEQIKTQFLPNSPPIRQLVSNVSFYMTNSHPALTNVIPSMPYYKEVGCLHCKPAKSLPKELEDYLQHSGEDGVIYFSLGSVTKGAQIPEEMKNKIINVFSKLPQRILWKSDSEITGLPKNVKLIKWAPQQDILGHPKLRLFISHGGGLSTLEAAYHGCPLLAFPLAADQTGNMCNAVKHQFGLGLDWKEFTEDEMFLKVTEILTNPSFKEKAIEVSTRMKDNPMLPRETAAYWVEYVIRHKGAPHLKSQAENLNFFQYFLVDVIAFLVFAFIIILSLVYLLLKFLFRMLVKLFTKRRIQKEKKIN